MGGVNLRGREGCAVLTVSPVHPPREHVSELIWVVNRDDFISRWRNTVLGREKAMRQFL